VVAGSSKHQESVAKQHKGAAALLDIVHAQAIDVCDATFPIAPRQIRRMDRSRDQHSRSVAAQRLYDEATPQVPDAGRCLPIGAMHEQVK